MYGFKEAILLNGGIHAWQQQKYPLSNEAQVEGAKGDFTFPFKRLETLFFAQKEDILRTIQDSSYVLIDTRSLDEYLGKLQKKGASRAGHIPTSIHLDWVDLINFNGDFRFKSCKENRAFIIRKRDFPFPKNYHLLSLRGALCSHRFCPQRNHGLSLCLEL